MASVESHFPITQWPNEASIQMTDTIKIKDKKLLSRILYSLLLSQA